MRLSSIFTAAGLLQAASANPIEPLEERQVVGGPCHNVHVFTARGSFEGYPNGDNRQNRLVVSAVCNGRNSCGYEDIVYPATIGNDYCGSQTQGVNNGLRQIREYANKCPQSNLILTGYSQGAQVIGDILGSAGGPTCDAGNGPLNPKQSPGNKIQAITLFGDTRRTPGQGYNKGSAGVDAVGAFPRGGAQLDGINQFAGKISSYCNAGDQWCAGGNDGAAHENAVEWNAEAAVQFINNQL